MRSTNTADTSQNANIVLWIAQGLLAALFLFAGGMKLVMPLAELTKQAPVPGLFLRFIGVCEVLGAVGLILPGALHIRRYLTPVAAVGLVLIMCGAVGATLAIGGGVGALMPATVGILAAAIAYGRRGWSPVEGSVHLLRPTVASWISTAA